MAATKQSTPSTRSNTRKRTTGTRSSSSTSSKKRASGQKNRVTKKTTTKKSTYEFPLKREITVLGTLALCILLFVSNFSLFGDTLTWLKSINLGIFGIIGYIFPIILFVSICFLIANAGNFRAKVKVFGVFLMLISACTLANVFANAYSSENTIISYYKMSTNGFGGGFIGGIFLNILYPYFGMIGCTIVFSLIFIVGGIIVTEKSVVSVVKDTSSKAYSNFQQDMEVRKTERAVRMEERAMRREKERYERLEEKRRQLIQLQEEKEEQRKRFDTPIRGIGNTTLQETSKEKIVPSTQKESSKKPISKKVEQAIEKNPNVGQVIPIDNGIANENQKVSVNTFTGEIFYSDVKDSHSLNDEQIVASDSNMQEITIDGLEPSYNNDDNLYEHIASDSEMEVSYSIDNNEGVYENNNTYEEELPWDSQEIDPPSQYDFSEDPIEVSDHTLSGKDDEEEYKTVVTSTGKVIRVELDGIPGAKKQPKISNQDQTFETFDASNGNYSQKFDSVSNEKPEIIAYEEPKEYIFPPMDLLQRGQAQTSQKNMEAELKQTAIKLQQTLQNFGVGVTVTNISCGPSVTRYELQPEQGVKVSKIVSLTDDIKLNLAAADIRMEAPIPGKAAIGIEVPNKENSTVMLRDLLEAKEFKEHSSNIAFAAGKDIGGQTIVADIAKMPHLLIAGATGSGKSVCINTLIISILYKSKPSEVKLIMIDPKVVELSVYNGIPHLLIPVVTDPKKAAGALNWAVTEMTERYKSLLN